MTDPLAQVTKVISTSWPWRRLLGPMLAIAAATIGGCGSDGPHASGCNLAAQTGCAAGQKCTYACSSGGAVIACVPNGTQAVGAACPADDMCVAGSFCASTGADPSPSCRALCATNAECPSGTCMQLPLQFCGTDTTIGICG